MIAPRSTVAVAIFCAVLTFPDGAAAQQQQPAGTRPAPRRQTSLRAFGDIGMTRFAAADTFDAVLGSSFGVMFGGGAEVVLPQRLFFSGRVSHFQKSGERVFVFEDEVFPLGIDADVSLTPIELSAGYRFRERGRNRNLIPYVGGGVGWHLYRETSDFAVADEDVSETLFGFHVLGGAEFRVGGSFAIGGEAQWTTVPDAFEENPGSTAVAFDETNLGGLSFRVRFTIGR